MNFSDYHSVIVRVFLVSTVNQMTTNVLFDYVDIDADTTKLR